MLDIILVIYEKYGGRVYVNKYLKIECFFIILILDECIMCFF